MEEEEEGKVEGFEKKKEKKGLKTHWIVLDPEDSCLFFSLKVIFHFTLKSIV